MTEITTAEARDKLAELVNRVAYGRERVTITRRGKALAVLVPVEDAEALEAIEDRIDLREARKALAEAKVKGTTPLAEFRRELLAERKS